MDIQSERRRLLDAEGGEEDPTGLMSEQDAYLSKVKNTKLYLATFASVLGPMSFGFVLGYSSPAIPELTQTSDPRLHLDDVQASWFGSIVTVGAAAGGLLGGWMVEKIGRKLSLMFCSLPFVFGFTIIIAAQNVWMLYLGRVLTGLASGVTSLVVPLYISEMAHERVRGTLGSCVQLMVVLGIMGVYLAGLFLDWRWLAICSSIPPTLLMVCMCFMPETPRFLLSQGKRREAEEALRFLRGPDAPVEWECSRIEDACEEQGSSFQLSDLKDPGDSDLASVIVGLIQVVFTAVAALIMDRAGRKVLLIISGVAMAISTTAFGVYFYLMSQVHSITLPSEEPHADLAWLALASMAVFITGFALGWGPIPWLIMSEVFPVKVRGFAGAVCVLTNWSMAFVVTKTFQDMMNALTSAGTFWLFACVCIVNVIFTMIFIPETKGKTLEQIEATFRGTEDSGKVMIWNMAPVLREEDEKNENIPKMLCQMDNHLDVMDVAWSPHDMWLASCSVDNTIVIWNARKFPEMVTCLRGHTGLVKGLTWDPVGKYIASQADDHSLKVWRTVDWQMEANITKPFSECGGTTHVLRLSWSPDGQYLVSAHAMNNSGPTAQIVERDGWKTNMDFVGHRKAVTVVKFNPKIFKKKQKNGSSPKPSCPYCCCAVGSKDRSLSVWLTSLKRPLVVIHDLFDKSIMDISWTLTGLGMLVCSMDGTVAYLDFSLDELGDPLSEEEKNSIHQNIYGKSLAITSTEAQLSTTIIENPEMLKYQQERQNSAQNNSGPGAAGPESSAPKLNSVMNGESLEDIRKNLLKKQVETRTADGRRRITPLCIAQLDTGDFSPALFNSVPILPSGSSMSSQLTPQLSSDSSPGQPSSLGLRPSHDAMLTSPPASSATKGLEDKDGVKSSLLLTSASKIEPMKALDSRFTERSKATPGVTAAISSTAGLAPLDRPKDIVSTLKDVKAKEDTSSDSEDKMASINKNLAFSKRKPDMLMDGAEVVEKKKKGRPRKEKMATTTIAQPFTQMSFVQQRKMNVLLSSSSSSSSSDHSSGGEGEQQGGSSSSSCGCSQAPDTQHTEGLQSAGEHGAVSVPGGGERGVPGGRYEAQPAAMLQRRPGLEHAAAQLRGDGCREQVGGASCLLSSYSPEVIAVACEDRMLSVFSSCGRRLLPAIQLGTPVSALHCSAHFVMALTAGATLSVWDVQKQKALVKNESLLTILSGADTTVSQSLLTQQGVPVIGLSNGKSYCFSPSLETWTLIADKGDSLVQCADFRSCLPTHDAPVASGPLAVMQGRNLNAGRLASRLSSTPHHLQQSMTLAFLENQLASALTLQSAQEYRYWLLIYARFLVNEGSEYRLRELCKELLGPVHKSAATAWEPTTLGLRKRELLREVLPVIGENLRFQRLFTEYQDQLELLRNK
ncbi:hypothetical protein INR49_008882 [Caranx melampygus]|nr:hypothetical protein INR49_008882 [Caranx melampygus]